MRRALLARLGGLWLASLRIRWHGAGPGPAAPGGEPGPALFLLWHEHLPVCLRAFAHRGIQVLVSRSADGGWAARACERLGYKVFRGSSTRGAVAGLKSLARGLEAGGAAGMALDGPRGPRGRAKPGSFWLARRAGVPVVPLAVTARWHFRLGTWDRSLIPLPFARVDIRVGPAFLPARAEEIEAAMAENQAALESILR